ncbi:type II toxin-antitoxin system RelB/DinJ family antitoxin [Candidatus Izemoplasma sp. B36]|uniref:type II toxin-antitoxin system RelB/DinJ family antitoxin n=1 Tax=Candidatus Izemoplasma sp. B36 TaxID=3242468 RepID=UPI0035586E8D
MAKNAYVNVRVEEEVKRRAEQILNELGINTSTAIDIYLNQIILKDGLPFDVKIPKSESIIEEDKLAEQLNVVKPYPGWFKRIAYLYSIGDINLATALFAGKQYLRK